jgi:hypothetical protein
MAKVYIITTKKKQKTKNKKTKKKLLFSFERWKKCIFMERSRRQE